MNHMGDVETRQSNIVDTLQFGARLVSSNLRTSVSKYSVALTFAYVKCFAVPRIY
jgi:hypothetical protein